MKKEILLNLLGARELRSFAAEALSAILDLWAGDKALRRVISKAFSARMKKGLEEADAVSLSDLFSDPLFARDFLTEAAPFIKGLMQHASKLVSALSKLPPRSQADIVSRFLQATDRTRVGSLITDAVSLLNRLYDAEPTFFYNNLHGWLKGLVTHTDFGELRELADRSRQDTSAMMSALLDELFAYPGKLVLLLSFILDGAAAAFGVLKGFLSRMNDMPPDLLCDIAASYFEKLNPSDLSELINQMAEFVRKLHIGSGLLGEVGSPRLSTLFTQFFERLYQGIDPKLALKAASAGAAITDAWHEATVFALSRDPELRASMAASKAHAFTSTMKTLTNSFAADEDMGPGEQEAFSQAVLAAIDLGRAAEAANAAVRRMLLFWDNRPELCTKILVDGIEAIDETSLLDLTERVLEAAGPSLREKLTPVLELIGNRLFQIAPYSGRTDSGSGVAGDRG